MSLALIRAVRLALAVEPVRDRLVAAHRALEVLEAAVQDLAHLDPVPPPFWSDVHRDAARTRGALARAPSLPWPLRHPPAVVALAAEEPAVVTAALIRLAEALVLHLLETAYAADLPDDAASCRRAAVLAHALAASLHRSTP